MLKRILNNSLVICIELKWLRLLSNACDDFSVQKAAGNLLTS
jgi:hypothetical protein